MNIKNVVTDFLDKFSRKVIPEQKFSFPEQCKHRISVVHKEPGYFIIQLKPWVLDPKTKEIAVEINDTKEFMYFVFREGSEVPVASGHNDNPVTYQYSKEIIGRNRDNDGNVHLIEQALIFYSKGEYPRAEKTINVVLNEVPEHGEAIRVARMIKSKILIADAGLEDEVTEEVKDKVAIGKKKKVVA